MTLDTLIVSCAVCWDWRRLVPLANIYLPRRRLFDLYWHIINNPKPDKKAQAYYRKKLNHRFNRVAYMNRILRQYPLIPEEFGIWVLEWPARLVVNGIWPGLPFTRCYLDTTATGGSSRKYGFNFIARKSPEVANVQLDPEHPPDNWTPSLHIWDTTWVRLQVPWRLHPVRYRGLDDDVTLWNCDTWLVIDQESCYFGKVMQLCDDGSPCLDEDDVVDTLPDWIDYLKLQWDGTAPCQKESRGTIIPCFTLDLPLITVPGGDGVGMVVERLGWNCYPF
ncbi:hypothetical protein CPB84DRAFT_1787314 [Gymnopilus junonius]|uniref:F-box domain-containing protein n=1 Tax=Gymnopilus junonius TaxID=109634 RepID=A0A9P5NJ97_GYMJU|nr:hypothetical protein CPB84DRAFT_1787314 [Gymnopilus junonius]